MAKTAVEDQEWEPVEFTIKFQFPDNKGTMKNGKYERRTKAIDPETPLFQYLTVLRNVVCWYLSDQNIDYDAESVGTWVPELELLTLREHLNSDILQRRADKLHLSEMDVCEFGYIKNKLVVYMDPSKVESYGPLHFVLATMGKCRPSIKELNDLLVAFQAGGTLKKIKN